MNATFQTEKLEDVRAEAEPLLLDHWREIALDRDRVPLDPDWDMYMAMEAAGMMHITTARIDGALVGYAAYFIGRNLHYRSLTVAEADIFWLAPQCRRGRIGIDLFRAAEAALGARGIGRIVVKCKLHHDVSPIFERLGYRKIECVLWKTVG